MAPPRIRSVPVSGLARSARSISRLGQALSVGALALGLAGCAAASYPPSDHYDGSRFFNPSVDNDKSLGDLLEWATSREPGPWPDFVPGRAAPSVPARLDAGEVAVTFVGHATFLVQLGTINVLTDPVFSERAGPVSFAGPLRVRRPGLSLDELPHVHAVIVSHNHYDHLDLPSLEQLHRRFRPTFVVPLGTAELLRSAGLDRVVELDWWQSHTLDPATSTEVVFAPALHWSGRGLFDRYQALWGSHYLRNGAGRSVYFGGDTGYGEHFREIARRLGSPDLALLPIGAYAPRWFMKDNHMDPADAVRAHVELGARRSVPMHYGTFRLADEGYVDPVEELARATRAVGTARPFEPLEVGATLVSQRGETPASTARASEREPTRK